MEVFIFCSNPVLGREDFEMHIFFIFALPGGTRASNGVKKSSSATWS